MHWLTKLKSERRGIATLASEDTVRVDHIETRTVTLPCRDMAAASARQMLKERQVFDVRGHGYNFLQTGNGNGVTGYLSVYKIVDVKKLPGYARRN